MDWLCTEFVFPGSKHINRSSLVAAIIVVRCPTRPALASAIHTIPGRDCRCARPHAQLSQLTELSLSLSLSYTLAIADGTNEKPKKRATDRRDERATCSRRVPRPLLAALRIQICASTRQSRHYGKVRTSSPNPLQRLDTSQDELTKSTSIRFPTIFRLAKTFLREQRIRRSSYANN